MNSLIRSNINSYTSIRNEELNDYKDCENLVHAIQLLL